jgi:hypothetical protein
VPVRALLLALALAGCGARTHAGDVAPAAPCDAAAPADDSDGLWCHPHRGGHRCFVGPGSRAACEASSLDGACQ